MMQARYSHLNPTTSAKEGDFILAGGLIGTMAAKGEKGVLHIEIGESKDGQACGVDDLNFKTVDPITVLDKPLNMDATYLTQKMSSLFNTKNATNTSVNDYDIRYANNEDLGEDEVYLRKYIEMLFYNSDLPSQDYTMEDILDYNKNTGVITIKLLFDETIYFVPEGSSFQPARIIVPQSATTFGIMAEGATPINVINYKDISNDRAKIKIVAITWDARGGSINGYTAPISQNWVSGLPFGPILPVPTRSGYDFDSWYNWQSGFKTKISKVTIVPSTNTTYYAEWVEGSGNELVSLAQLDEFEFYMGNTEEEKGANLQELNRVLEQYGINTDLRIAFFMGNVFKESSGGTRTLEKFNGDDPEAYFNATYDLAHAKRTGTGNLGGNDGETFRGSGYIQLTGRGNYTSFSNYVGNPNIIEQGYRLVGGTYNKPVNEIKPNEIGVIDIGKYAWEASGWFWEIGNPKGSNLNLYADKKDYSYILSMINSNDTDTIGQRNKYTNDFYRILTGNELGLPE